MHLTLKLEATKPAAANSLQQQPRFDAFVTCYTYERPHQALDMRVPAELYEPSPRPYRGLTDLDYPLHDWTATVTLRAHLLQGPQDQSQPGFRGTECGRPAGG